MLAWICQFSSHHYNDAIQDESTVLRSHKTCEIKLQLVVCEHQGHIGDKLGGKQAMALRKHASRLCSSYCWTTDDADSTSLPFQDDISRHHKNMPCSAYHLYTAKLVKWCNQSAIKITCEKDYLDVLQEGNEDPRIVKGRKRSKGKRYILICFCIFPMRENTGRQVWLQFLDSKQWEKGDEQVS